MCLAQGHNTVTPVRLGPAAPWSRVKHSTTEPLCSPPALLKFKSQNLHVSIVNKMLTISSLIGQLSLLRKTDSKTGAIIICLNADFLESGIENTVL